ncbi:unnamed protein product [Polarella glacialis]|uniref:Uncharacterized protein n=1 Tax=Polarella glacialis TaxID=89957 RepID=A0A813F8P7_POLGL|nr:unnamed protein product [Polarella glacialis]
MGNHVQIFVGTPKTAGSPGAGGDVSARTGPCGCKVSPGAWRATTCCLGAQPSASSLVPDDVLEDSMFLNLLEAECPELWAFAADVEALDRQVWARVEAGVATAFGILYGSHGGEHNLTPVAPAFQHYAGVLHKLFAERPTSALACPALSASHLRRASEWAVAVGQPARGRALLQLGGAFRLQGMWKWLEAARADEAFAKEHPRYQTRLHAESTIAVGQLHGLLEVPLQPLRRWSQPRPPAVEIHSLCHYPGAEDAATAPAALPQLSVPNHRAYAAMHGHRYVLHTELLQPDLEPQYAKISLMSRALRSETTADWILFIDCDAFFTNFSVAVGDLLETYQEAAEKHFLVAEDPGGINTGVFLLRKTQWSLDFFDRVEQGMFRMAWDQSMFLWEILRGSLLDTSEDFQLPKEVAFVHQAHLNAFVPPASRDWNAYEWQPGDVIRHFAGCPHQEEPCYKMMVETAELAKQQWPSTSGASEFSRETGASEKKTQSFACYFFKLTTGISIVSCTLSMKGTVGLLL